jgi:hypothetical protein
MLLAWDDSVSDDFVTLPAPGQLEDVPIEPIVRAFKAAYFWLPAAMKPAVEDSTRKGIWEHPFASVNIEVERYPSLWETHKFPKALASELTRLVKNYLPLLSIPFESTENLKKGIITAASQERGERVLLAYYWALAKMVRTIPETEGETLIKRIVAYVESHRPETTRRKLAQSVSHNSAKDFDAAIRVIIDRDLLRYKRVVNKNKTVSEWFFPLEKAPAALAPLSMLPPRAELETPSTMTGRTGTDNLPKNIAPEPPATASRNLSRFDHFESFDAPLEI